ncbi:MAG: hypothetical protein WBG50_24165 [Desulfomonilaceae bacterium]
MTESIPVNLLERWISEIQSILKEEIREAKTDLKLNQGITHGLDQIQHKLNTRLQHQDNVETLKLSGKKFLITKYVNLSDGSTGNWNGIRTTGSSFSPGDTQGILRPGN